MISAFPLSCHESGKGSTINWRKNGQYKNIWIIEELESCLGCKEIQPVHPKGNESWLFIGRTDAQVKLQYFGHLMGRTDSLENTLMLGKIEGERRRGWQRMRWLDGIADLMDMSLSKLRETVKETWLSNRITQRKYSCKINTHPAIHLSTLFHALTEAQLGFYFRYGVATALCH